MISTHLAAGRHLDDVLAKALVDTENGSSHGPKGSSAYWRSGGDVFRISIPNAADGEPVLMDASWTIDGIDGTIDLAPIDENAAAVARILADAFPAPFGRILHDADEDRFGNKVSIAMLRSGKRMRIVHHPFRAKEGRRTPAYPRYRYSTVYAGRGVFVKMTEDRPSSDCMCQTLTLAGYVIPWGDGDLLDVDNAPGGPDLKKLAYEHLSGENYERATLMILSAIEEIPEMWQTREPRADAVSGASAQAPSPLLAA